MSVFGRGYAGSYDQLYADKDYPAECDLIDRLLHEYESGRTRSILDLGCGTGNHAQPLAERGYDVVGVDQSDEMLSQIRTKSPVKAAFRSGDIRSIQLGRKFDAALMMFAVLGYQVDNTHVLSALKNTRTHLNTGAVFLFDVWYGPAVLNMRPSERTKVIPTPEGQIVRFASGCLDIGSQVCTVTYQLWRVQEDRIISRCEERHAMRYFFPLEIDLLLQSTGFRKVRIGAFPEFTREPDEHTWNVLVVAKAVE